MTKKQCSYGISRDAFRPKLHTLQPAHFTGAGALFTAPGAMEKERDKAPPVGLIWSTQIRYDLPFIFTALAASIPMDILDPRFLFRSPLVRIGRSANEFARINILASSISWWRICTPSSANYVFSGDGFANPPNRARGKPFRRYRGSIVARWLHYLRACPIFWGSWEIHRAGMSSLSRESVALRSAIEHTYWLQSVLRELLRGGFLREQFDHSPPTALLVFFYPAIGALSDHVMGRGEFFCRQRPLFSPLGQ